MEEKILNKKAETAAETEKKAKLLFQSIAFRVDKSVYAMDVMHIQEIIFARKIHRVPNTSDALLGVLNLRGNILPVYSLKLVLGLDDQLRGKNVVEEEENFIIMIKKDRDVFGIFIDSVYKTIPVTEDNYKTGKYIEQWSKNTLFSGVVLEEEKEILVINMNSLLKYIVSLK